MSRVLILCHAAAAAETVRAAAHLWPNCDLDLLAYGRAAAALPVPAGVHKLDMPPHSGHAGTRPATYARYLASLRRRRYVAAVLAAPGLGRSRARGLLLFFPLLAGARRTVVVDPLRRRELGQVTPRTALVDLARWLIIRLASAVLAAAFTKVLGRLRVVMKPPSVRFPRGLALYLRTDVELADSPLQAGGSAAHTDGILRALRRRGDGVQLWSTGSIKGIPRGIPERRLTVLRAGNTPTEVRELLSSLIQMRSLPRVPRPGFIYQRHSLNNLTGVWLGRRLGVPLLLEANASEVRWRSTWSTLRYPKLAAASEQLVFTAAARIVAVSDNAARELVEAGADPARVMVVPNGVEVTQFADASPVCLPFPNGSFTIGFAGLFYPWHGVTYLVQAFDLLASRYEDVRLLLVGDGEEAPRAHGLLSSDSLANRTHLTGFVPRSAVPGYLAAVDVLVSPHAGVRDFIGSPIKLFEYMASGRAIVASRVGQIAQVLRDGETALLVPPEDPRALADAIARLRANPELRRHLGRRAQEEARERHSWDARLEQILRDEPVA